MCPKVSITSKPSKKVCILPFLRGLLDDPTKTNIICWTDNSRLEFRLVDQNKVAELWGATKPGRKVEVMTYDNMARSLREFVKANMLEKMGGRTCGYRFVNPLAFGIDRILSDDFGSQVPRPQSTSNSFKSSTSSGTSSPTVSSYSSSVDDIQIPWTPTPAQLLQIAQLNVLFGQYHLQQ